MRGILFAGSMSGKEIHAPRIEIAIRVAARIAANVIER